MESTDAGKLPSALERMPEILRKCGDKRIAVFLDYDGTLTPIVQRPEDAVMSPEMRDTVSGLAKSHTVAIISGRDLMDVRSMVKIEGIYYAGSHGFDIEAPDGRRIEVDRAAGSLEGLESAERKLRDSLAGLEGVQIERKRYSIAIHYRRARETDLEKVKNMVEKVKKESSGLRRSSGKKVYELQPDVAWNKGEALLWLLEELAPGESEVMPFYLGDDTTDEDAFAVLTGRGIGIIIRDEPRGTKADYALDDVGQVRSFLERLASLDKGRERI